MLARLIAAAAAWFVLNGLLFLVLPLYPATAVSVVCAVLAVRWAVSKTNSPARGG